MLVHNEHAPVRFQAEDLSGASLFDVLFGGGHRAANFCGMESEVVIRYGGCVADQDHLNIAGGAADRCLGMKVFALAAGR